MRRKQQSARTPRLVAALGFLAVSGWIAVSGVMSLGVDEPTPPAKPLNPDEIDDDPQPGEKRREDLLRRHGSFAPAASVADRFSRLANAELGSQPTADPIVAIPDETEPETQPNTNGTKAAEKNPDEPEEEEKLPEHDVTLILLTKQSARAIVDGRLVGIGDVIAAGKILAIRADGVLVQRGQKRILFHLRPR